MKNVLIVLLIALAYLATFILGYVRHASGNKSNEKASNFTEIGLTLTLNRMNSSKAMDSYYTVAVCISNYA